jgi:hypothetical protein
MATEDQQQQTIKGRWNQLDTKRKTVLDRARKCAKLTIPSLMPPDGANEDISLETPYQGLGARGVNHLASKLLITLLPPNRPFFRLGVDDYTLEELGQNDQRAEVEKRLAEIERTIMREVETKALRVPSFEALKLLIATGNALTYQPDSGGMKVFRLDQYVVKRDPMGNVLEIITREEIAPMALPDEIRDAVLSQVDEAKEDKDEPLELFTYIRRDDEDGEKWLVSQECAKVQLPDSEGNYPIDESPWQPLRWTALAGEDYGRGLVEEYLGDFMTLEALTRALTEGTTLAARVLYLLNPNGITRAKKITEAANGAVIEGREEDITTLKLDKFTDFRIAYETINKIEERLAHAFLLMESVQRDAERVTAEEVRTMAKELEDSLGGVYSVLSQEFQLPLVKRLIRQLEKQGEMPKLPDQVVEPSITTGIEALGRGNDLQKLSALVQGLAPLGEQTIGLYLNAGDYIQRLATALGIDSDGLVNSKEDVQQQMQMQQMQGMVGQALPGVAQELTKGVVQGSNGEQGQQGNES